MNIADDEARARALAETLKAIANPTRLRLAAALCEGPSVVGALAERLVLAPAIVSQELRILRMSGLVGAERAGGFSTYSLAEPGLKDLIKCLDKCPRA
jgi:DNA-binding transcriptional ArsR family regulator